MILLDHPLTKEPIMEVYVFFTTGRGTVKVDQSSTNRLTPGQVVAHRHK